MLGNKVLGVGPKPAQIMLVGEGPGRQESIDGVPFCGASGSELTWLYLKRAAGIDRNSIYITNIVKWRTDEDDSDPTEEDIKRDEAELEQEVDLVNPQVIVAVGRIAARWFMQREEVDLDKYHGVPIVCPRYPWRTLLVAYHPAAGLHQPERYNHLIYWDFEQLGRTLRGELQPVTDEQGVAYAALSPNGQFGEQLSGAKSLPIVAVDTEGNVANPWGLSLSWEEGKAYVSKKAVELKEHRLVMHNSLYDAPVLSSMGTSVNWLAVEDTMLMAYLIPWLPRGLKPLAFKLCGMEMQSYEEVIGEAEEKVAQSYLQKVLERKCITCDGKGTIDVPYKRTPTKFKSAQCGACHGDGTSWPLPEPQLLFDRGSTPRVYKPRSTGRRVREILKRGTASREGWQNLDGQVRKHVEGEFGPMREATLDDIPIEKAIHYSARDADATLRVYNKLEPMLKKEGLWNVYQIDKGIVPIVDRMHSNGIRIDRDYFHNLDAEFDTLQSAATDKLCVLVGRRINPSSPVAVSEVLYSSLGLRVQRGERSTDEKTMEALKIRYSNRPEVTEIIDCITDYRELVKLRGTYVQPLPLWADSADRVHTRFLLHVTNSGRLSSRDPNLQNIPKRTERGKTIRKGFIPKEGCRLVSVDLDQIELRVTAHVSEDDNMINIFKTGQDIHKATAALIYKVAIDDVTPQQRLLSKTINFGILYGMSAKRLQRELALLGIVMSFDECINIISDWFKAYPGIEQYMERCRATAKQVGYVECLFGRRRYLPGVHSTLDKVREESFRWAGNHPVQGTAAGLLKIWMRRVWDNVLPAMAGIGYCQPLLTIHDELLFEVEKGLENLLIPLVVREAANTAQLLVPISAKGSSADSWGAL